MSSLSFAPDLLDEITRHAEACYPRECCGALLGLCGEATAGEASHTDGDVTRVLGVVACDNAAPEPLRRYAIDPRELFDLERLARRTGLEVVGYYHSHPSTDGRPSATDRSEAWPGIAYVIIPMSDGAARPPRGWRFSAQGEPIEQAIACADSGGPPHRHETL